MTRFDPAQVRHYYDRHTSAFVAYGEGKRVGAIHRAVWGPDVHDRDGAFHYVDDRIADLARGLKSTTATPHLVDLGCGVAASLIYLAEQLPIRGTGITLSPVQAWLAATNVRAAGLADRITCVEGDYCELPASVDQADLAYAIESFVHVQQPARFFEQCRQLVRPGGLLVICDDFKSDVSTDEAERAREEFCHGWHINTLLRPGELNALARSAGFEHQSTSDLSPYLRIDRGRDRLISVFLSLLETLHIGRTRFDDLLGGRALQTCLRRGWVSYRIAVFRRDTFT